MDDKNKTTTDPEVNEEMFKELFTSGKDEDEE